MRGSVIVREDEQRWGFTRDKCGELSVSATGDTVGVGGQADISVTAAYTNRIPLSQLWTDRDVASDVANGASSDRVQEARVHELDWDFNQMSPSLSMTVSLPERYVGGDYLLAVTATNAYGDTAETTVLLCID